MTDKTGIGMIGENIWERDEIDSPCQKICVMHPDSRLCIGCLRTLDEIARWSKLDQGERDTIRAALPERAPLIKGRRKRSRQRSIDQSGG